jgi:hypothetical protein
MCQWCNVAASSGDKNAGMLGNRGPPAPLAANCKQYRTRYSTGSGVLAASWLVAASGAGSGVND